MASSARSLNGTQDSTLVDATDATRVTKVMGLCARETAGAAAVFRIREGSNAGRILATVRLAANESVDFDWDDGRKCAGDLIEDWVSGAYEGSVFVL
jgi:hypothetical protein